jgi:ABC-type transporter Mla maintaining outer membrane lipid asymmetry permease subunit MlaE
MTNSNPFFDSSVINQHLIQSDDHLLLYFFTLQYFVKINKYMVCGMWATQFSSYTAMIATFWGKTNGEPDGVGSSTTGDESMWLIIASEWVFLLLYCKVLHAAYLDRQENL